MPKSDLVVSDDLKSKFREFEQIAAITGQLQETVETINRENKRAAGTDDAIARTYHQQIDEPTTFLTDLVASIQQEFHLTSDRGGAAADTFERAHDNALWAATNW